MGTGEVVDFLNCPTAERENILTAGNHSKANFKFSGLSCLEQALWGEESYVFVMETRKGLG